jgi:hypothetical protein
VSLSRKPKPLASKRPVRVRIVTGPFVRVVLLAALAVTATVWATWHYYTRGHPPMIIPVPPSAGSQEVPAPEVVPAEVPTEE